MTAIYARQSIDKKDSISIETQIEACKRCTDGEFRVYSDKGWSGKDLDRPQFQQLLRDIRSGEISKATFVVDSVKSWVIDAAQIKNAASTDFTLIPTRKLKTGALAGTEGVQFTVSSADIPAGIAVSFKANFAGRFANLYKSVDGKLVFMGCAKLDSTGKSTVPGIDGKGDYAVMLSELSALPGDMNNDGILNALDASEILKYSVGISAGANLAAADLNGDGTVNASDAAAVLRMAVG